jgi:hypothetical protein
VWRSAAAQTSAVAAAGEWSASSDGGWAGPVAELEQIREGAFALWVRGHIISRCKYGEKLVISTVF